MENTSTRPTSQNRKRGCGQIVVIGLALLWFSIIPTSAMLLTNLLKETLSHTLQMTAAITATSILLLPPFLISAFLTRHRRGWEPTATTVSALLVTSGYLILEAIIQALFSDAPNILAALQLMALIPYSLLAQRLLLRLAGESQHTPSLSISLVPGKATTLWLALGLAMLITLPWPITGALGDRYTSLARIFQTLAGLIPAILLIWGVIFTQLTRRFTQPWSAALVTILIAGGLIAGQAIPHAAWGMLANSIVLLPLACLLTELRARDKSTVPLLIVGFAYIAAPRLFTDPRDVVAQGIPELQHILSFVIAWSLMTLAGPCLWAGRKLLTYLGERITISPRTWKLLSAVTAVILTLTWIGVYLTLGNPGFTDDGYLIILEEQANLQNAQEIPDREARLQSAYDALVETAERTQAPLRAELDKQELPYRPYYLINMIRVDGHSRTMQAFKNYEGVAQVIRNPNVRQYPHRIAIPYGPDTEPLADLQENLKAIQVEGAWDLGITGKEIVVAGQDTGYDWSHPALMPHYRGWDGQQVNHDYNWHDAWDDTAEAFDDDAHGTHTMGTILGDDGQGNQTGIAPGAQWIGCRNMRRGVGNPASYTECMEYFLAPYPHGGDPFTDGDVRMAPHVINNSWGCPEEEGCFADTLQPAVEALRAAGIMMVVSAGNDGPACSTAATTPANYDAVFSIGATYDNGTITGFSSRGPVEGLLKPDISAPGASVRSSVPGDTYGYASGTSMAGPHVAGLVALVWSANPALIGNIDATEQLLCETATPKAVDTACTAEEATFEDPLGLEDGPICGCGDVTGTPNNVYGCGLINAEEAVRAALEQQN